MALPQLQERCEVPVWGVIDAGVEAATRATRTGSVRVIGTKATIGSGAYQQRLEKAGLRVWSQACPLLVHLVEEGLAQSPEAGLLVRHYLAGRPEIDRLILGCTHYSVLRDVPQRAVGEKMPWSTAPRSRRKPWRRRLRLRRALSRKGVSSTS